MAVYTFSTRPTKPRDTELIERVKQECDLHGKSFSALIISLLRARDDNTTKA